MQQAKARITSQMNILFSHLQAGSLQRMLRDLAADEIIVIHQDGAVPHGLGGFDVLDLGAFRRFTHARL